MDKSPVHNMVTRTQATIRTHCNCQFGVACWPAHVFGVWEEFGVPGEPVWTQGVQCSAVQCSAAYFIHVFERFISVNVITGSLFLYFLPSSVKSSAHRAHLCVLQNPSVSLWLSGKSRQKYKEKSFQKGK